MKLASLFDGIAGFPYAASMLGIEPIWASEIEKFPIAVSKYHFPNMKHYGSVCDIKGAEVEPIDIITFGSPCQDLSVAGKRAGMGEGTRSGLFSEAVRIIKEMRSGTDERYPRFAVWENVPGAFSSNKGEDFRAVVESLAKIAEETVSIPLPKDGRWEPAGLVEGDGWSIAWRTLDAQFWGVPQRRKRIFLVADFGGQCASEIFFERESVSGDIAAGGNKREEVAGGVEGGVRATGPSDGISYALRSGASKADKPDSTTYVIQGNIVDRSDTAEANGAGVREDICYTLNTIDRPAVCVTGERTHALTKRMDGSEDGTGRGTPIVVDAWQDPVIATDKSHSLQKSGCQAVFDARGNGEISPTITGDHQNRITDYTAILVNAEGSEGATCTASNLDAVNNQTPLVVANCLRAKANLSHREDIDTLINQNSTVRRLTPLECERLQGFPDYWTNIPGASDSARYKALGNSVAIPCVKFILGCIARSLNALS